MNSDILNGKVIWITGGNRGIGSAISMKLLESNPKLIISATSTDSLSKTVPLLKNNSNVELIACNLLNEHEINNTANQIIEQFGKIDFLINNAGVLKFSSLVKATTEEFDNQIGVNLKGMFLCSRVVLPSMLERNEGAIININSVSSINSYKYNSVYSASKAGALAMSRCLREEVRSEGIKVVDIILGATDTEIWRQEAREKFGVVMMKPSDIAEAVFQVVLLCLNKKLMIEEIIVRPQIGDL